MLQISVPNVLSIFQTYVVSVFIWMLHMFTHMLQVFYLHVTYVCNGFQVFFQVFQTHDSSVSSVFRHMLQVLHLDVLKIYRVLHMWSGGGADAA
jgi:hypothetical protein